jgi:hypothetical protein
VISVPSLLVLLVLVYEFLLLLVRLAARGIRLIPHKQTEGLFPLPFYSCKLSCRVYFDFKYSEYIIQKRQFSCGVCAICCCPIKYWFSLFCNIPYPYEGSGCSLVAITTGYYSLSSTKSEITSSRDTDKVSFIFNMYIAFECSIGRIRDLRLIWSYFLLISNHAALLKKWLS